MPPEQRTLDVKQSLNNAIKVLLEALQDASKLTVETYIFPVGGAGTETEDYKGKIVARTIFEIDGDTIAGLPALVDDKGEATGGVDKELLDLHNQNLERALTNGSADSAILFKTDLRDGSGQVINARPLGVAAAGSR